MAILNLVLLEGRLGRDHAQLSRVKPHQTRLRGKEVQSTVSCCYQEMWLSIKPLPCRSRISSSGRGTQAATEPCNGDISNPERGCHHSSFVVVLIRVEALQDHHQITSQNTWSVKKAHVQISRPWHGPWRAEELVETDRLPFPDFEPATTNPNRKDTSSPTSPKPSRP